MCGCIIARFSWRSIVDAANDFNKIDNAADTVGSIRGIKQSLDKSTNIQIHTTRGRINESKALDDIGVQKNTTMVKGRTKKGELINTIPDAITPNTVYEVKDVKTLSYTKQIQDQEEYALLNGLDYKIYTGINTHVSKNVPKEYIIRLNYLGPQK